MEVTKLRQSCFYYDTKPIKFSNAITLIRTPIPIPIPIWSLRKGRDWSVCKLANLNKSKQRLERRPLLRRAQPSVSN